MSDVKPSPAPSPSPAAAPAGVAAAAGADPRRPRIVGFLCDWAVSSEGLVHEDGRMRALPNVVLIKVPCSGFVRPSWLEFALRNGADAAFVCGCPLGDCFNRLGNNLIADRVVQMRRRLERQKIQPGRVETIFYGLHDQAAFVAAVREFNDRVAALPGPAIPAPAPRRPAPGPAPAPGAAAAPAAAPAASAAPAPSRPAGDAPPPSSGPAGQGES
jgi:coenzyme F420-reducing hydrogenase delta subunit